MTSNAPDTMYAGLLQNYQNTLSRFIGPTKVLVSGETLQLKDYSKTDWPWTMFDPEARQKRHETVFPKECKKAYENKTTENCRQKCSNCGANKWKAGVCFEKRQNLV